MESNDEAHGAVRIEIWLISFQLPSHLAYSPPSRRWLSGPDSFLIYEEETWLQDGYLTSVSLESLSSFPFSFTSTILFSPF